MKVVALLLVLGTTLAAAAAASSSASPDAGVTGAPDGGATAPPGFHFPIEILSEHLQVQGKMKQAIWTKNVHATRGPTKLACDRLVAHYYNGEEIRTMECLGHVEVEDGNKWAKGDRADFDNITGVVVITGNPEAREGRNWMKGNRIIFDTTRDTLEVEHPNSIFETKGGAPSLPRISADAGVAPAPGKGHQ